MLAIPYNTDAPIYFFPFATVGLIIVNTLLLISEYQVDPLALAPWILQFGDGFHPLQWISHTFLHQGPVHLIGNMFFLWGFGLVVEGKLGWWKFLLLYLSIAACTGFFEQLVMLHAEGGGALGASGVLFGLMIISAIWAPKNEMNCFLWIFFRPQVIEVQMTVFATCYVVWEIVMAALAGFSMSTAVLHLDGALFGAIFGVALLKLNWVDCEGWDLFAVWAGREGKWAKPKEPPKPPPDLKPLLTADHAQFLTTAFQNRLKLGDAAGAAKLYQSQRQAHPEWTLSEVDLMSLVKSLHQQKLWTDSLPVMVDYLRQFPDKSVKMRLKLAQILIDSERRPTRALKVLSKLQPTTLPDDLKAICQKLIVKAQKLQEECDIEIVDGEDW